MSDNPYNILGVKPDASDKEIKSAYRRLAKSLHPDLNPGSSDAEDRFKSVSAAYNLLKDKEQRARFDRGEIDASGAETQPYSSYRSHAGADAGHHYHDTSGFSDFADESDFFERIFGHARQQHGYRDRSTQKRRGADVQYSLEVGFLDAALGANQRVTMPDGVSLDVSIPAGLADGQTLRLKGKGLPGHAGGPHGDAHIKIAVKPHPFFKRQKRNILIEMPITLDEAVLGGKVSVPTLFGKVSMNVPAGASSGQTLRLKGKGIKASKTHEAGDQLVTLKITMPEKLDEELMEFFKSWREKHSYEVRQVYEGSV